MSTILYGNRYCTFSRHKLIHNAWYFGSFSAPLDIEIVVNPGWPVGRGLVDLEYDYLWIFYDVVDETLILSSPAYNTATRQLDICHELSLVTNTEAGTTVDQVSQEVLNIDYNPGKLVALESPSLLIFAILSITCILDIFIYPIIF